MYMYKYITSAGVSITVYDWDAKSAQLKPVGIYEVRMYVLMYIYAYIHIYV